MALNRVKGGKKLDRFVRNARESGRRQVSIEVGFRDRRINALALLLEFGNPGTNLPERPAFRLGAQSMRDAVSRWLATHYRSRDLRTGRLALSPKEAIELAVLARDEIRHAYPIVAKMAGFCSDSGAGVQRCESMTQVSFESCVTGH